MRFTRPCIPLGVAWSSPFARWQGPLAEVNSLDLAVDVARRAMSARGIDPAVLTRLILGWTIPQETSFYGAPTVAARLGAPGVSGPMLAQACATSAVCVATAAAGIEAGDGDVTLVLTTDRTSNGPLMLYPTPSATDGAPRTEHWVLDNFQRDPNTGQSMLQTAENVAEEIGAARQELDEVTLLRYQQYDRALADGRAFQKRFMVAAEVGRGRKTAPLVVDSDSGVFSTTAEGLAALEPVLPSGVVTFGMQTHPADGTAGLIVTTEERARALGDGDGIVRLLGSGTARVEKGRMPKAPVPAAERALADAGLSFSDIDAITTHNPFAVNDIFFARMTGYPLEKMNQYGCSLVWGHPQGPTGARAIAELIETLRLRGGGTGLFTGCAAGDTGAAIVVRVED
ncbi:MAG: thiolase family protein [Chloroflexi bacterium]|nr:thiolase family protein [Chloroflexota bacterium]